MKHYGTVPYLCFRKNTFSCKASVRFGTGAVPRNAYDVRQTAPIAV